MGKTDEHYLLNQHINKESTRTILFGLAMLTLFGMGVILMIQINNGNTREVYVLLLGMIPILLTLGFLYYGYLELSGVLIAISLTITITILATIGQGAYDIGTMAYPAILIFASLILKRNTVIYLTSLVILCNGWLVFGAIYGFYQPIYPNQSFPRQFVIISLIIVITMTAIYILSTTVRNSLKVAQSELRKRQKMEQALRETETMYRALVEETTVVAYRDQADSLSTPLYISPQIENLVGFTAAEWISDPELWMTLVHPNDLNRVEVVINNYQSTGAKSVSEYRLRTKDDHWIWVRDEAIVVRDEEGKPQYVHGVYIDITEQKNAERKLQQREEILGAVAETAKLLLRSSNWRYDINAILKLLGEATGASHVYIFENHPGANGVMLSSEKYEWASPGTMPELDDPVYQNTRLITVSGIEDWFTNLSTGKLFYGSGKQYPRYWKKAFEPRGLKTLLDVPILVHGEWWGVIGFDDYSNEMPWSQAEIDALVAAAGILGTSIERQKTDEGLRASEEKFHLAFHHTYVSMAISRTLDNTLLDVNGSFCKVTGYSRDEVIGRRAGRDLNIWVNQEDRNLILDTLGKHGFIDDYKAKFRRKNGDIGVGLLSAVNVSISGEACQLYSFIDISDIDQLLNELKAKNDELQSFTYTVSHDLKAPLVTISGFMGYLEQDARNGDIEKMGNDIHRINEAVSKMQTLLTDLLELSRIGRLMNPPEDVPYGEIIREALGVVGGRLEAGHVKVEVDRELPVVYGDRARLVEVIQNLVDNAAKFMGAQKEPWIEIGVDHRNNNPTFFVRDNGIGIALEQLEKIFGLFNKLDVNQEGTGIGLALVKRIIEVHGGKIWAESDGEGKGSTFYFTLADHPNIRVQNEK